jgi:ubiquinone/menaquinone biosynthesis C-methylase UbiE
MPETSEVSNPLFARLYANVLRAGEGSARDPHRRELLSGLSGRVLDLGAGDGVNFPFFPPGVSEVIAVEPEPYLRRRAEQAAGKAPVPVEVVDAIADELPLADGEVDAAVTALVLCSVPSQETALAELRRVVCPGGELRFYEHVVANKPAFRALQRFVQGTFWPRFFGNCHPARDTAAAIRAAGFEIERCRRFPFRAAAVEPHVPYILGAARRPA